MTTPQGWSVDGVNYGESVHIVAAMISSQGATILCVHVTPTLRARGSGRPSRPPREPSPRGGEPESPGGEPDSPGGGADSPGGEPRLPGWGAAAPQAGEPRLPRAGSRGSPGGEPGSTRGAGGGSPSGSPRELGRRPRGRTGCAGFVHPSHPSSLQKHTFAHLWPG